MTGDQADILGTADLRNMWGVSGVTIWNAARDGRLPPPTMTAHRMLWTRTVIDDWAATPEGQAQIAEWQALTRKDQHE